MSNKTPHCDSCGRRIRRNHHELVLRDFSTGQILGHYHSHPGCQVAAAKYVTPGVALRATVYHPECCGDALVHCGGGVPEGAA
jgi:hypothetical protein